MSTIEKTKTPFANVPVADFVGIILDGGEQADEAMYYLLHRLLYLPLKKRYEIVHHHLLDDFDDILDDFFFYLRDGEEDGGQTGNCDAADEIAETPEGGQPIYPSVRRIRNPEAFVLWLLRTFRNYLSMRTAKEGAIVCTKLDTGDFPDRHAGNGIGDGSPHTDAASSILTDERKLAIASHLIAYAHQEMTPRDAFLLFRALLSMLDKRRSVPRDEMAGALGMTDVSYRVAVHRVKGRLARYRARLLQGEPLRLDDPHRRMAERIHEDFLHLYPTLLFYYDQTISSLDRDCAGAVRRLRQTHLDFSGDLLHENATPYKAKFSREALWNLVGRFIGG